MNNHTERFVCISKWSLVRSANNPTTVRLYFQVRSKKHLSKNRNMKQTSLQQIEPKVTIRSTFSSYSYYTVQQNFSRYVSVMRIQLLVSENTKSSYLSDFHWFGSAREPYKVSEFSIFGNFQVFEHNTDLRNSIHYEQTLRCFYHTLRCMEQRSKNQVLRQFWKCVRENGKVWILVPEFLNYIEFEWFIGLKLEKKVWYIFQSKNDQKSQF